MLRAKLKIAIKHNHIFSKTSFLIPNTSASWLCCVWGHCVRTQDLDVEPLWWRTGRLRLISFNCFSSSLPVTVKRIEPQSACPPSWQGDLIHGSPMMHLSLGWSLCHPHQQNLRTSPNPTASPNPWDYRDQFRTLLFTISASLQISLFRKIQCSVFIKQTNMDKTFCYGESKTF